MQPWIWVIVEFSNACFEIYLMQMFVALLLNKKLTATPKLKIIIFSFAILTNFYVNFFFSNNMSVITSKTIIMVFILAISLFQYKIYWVIIAALSYTILGVLAELLAAVIVTIPQRIAFSVVTTFDVYRFQAIIVTEILYFILLKFIGRFRKGHIDEIPLKILLPLLVLPISSIVIALQITYNAVLDTSPQSLFTAISVVCLVYINVVVFTLVEGIIRRGENDKRLGIAEAQLAIQKEHIIQVTQTHSKIQHMAHDFKQHVHVLQSLCDSKRYEELSNALHKLSDEQLITTQIVFTENPMIDAVLSGKKELAERNDILCSWKISIAPSLSIKELGLCAILGNALDNSIEACLRTTGRRFINIDLHVDNNNLLCKITNAVGEIPKADGIFLKTSKREVGLHGIGLQSMQRCCESLGGDMSFDYDSEVFELRIFIPIMSFTHD